MGKRNSLGRPFTSKFEKQFMKKLRQTKIQVINSECDLQICLINQIFQRFLTKQTQQIIKSQQSQTDLIRRVHNLQIGLEHNFSSQRRKILLQNFKLFNNKWEFQQFKQDQPLPNYLFDNGCDLSYIIYQLRNSFKLQFQNFTPQDIIFLKILCLLQIQIYFRQRNQLNNIILDYISENMNYMIDLMNFGFQKIKQKLSFQKTNETYKSRKNKKIKKQKNRETKGSNNQKYISQKQIENINLQQQNLSNNLAFNICNNSLWAYWYVIKPLKIE